jgi:hypothetical protein
MLGENLSTLTKAKCLPGYHLFKKQLVVRNSFGFIERCRKYERASAG